MKKEIGFIGLGKMGKNMAERLASNRWNVFGFNKSPITARNVKMVSSLKELAESLSRPRILWLMIPSGKSVEDTLFSKIGLVNLLDKGDIIIDGGNSFFEDSIRRKKVLVKKGIIFLDAGISGGPEGAKKGACVMVGGEKKAFLRLKPLFRDLATKDSFQYVGSLGAGHFVKMVHNGIEYGMMQAIAEGFDIMRHSAFRLNLKEIAELYNKGSVVESKLIGWLAKAFIDHGQELKGVSGTVGHTGEGEWTIKTARKLKIPAKVIEDSFRFRVKSERNPSYAGKILSALREQFGGHTVK